MARTYNRDNRGRFASGGGGGGGGSKGKAKGGMTKVGDRLGAKAAEKRSKSVTGGKSSAKPAMSARRMSSVPAGTVAKGGAVARSLAAFRGGAGTKVNPAAPKTKAAMTKAADKARAADLRAKGTTGLGMRVKAKGFGGKKAKETSGGLLTGGRATAAPSSGRISGKASVRAAGAEKRAKAAQRKASKAGMKPGTRMSKAAPSAAKAAFKALRSEQRSADRKGMTEAFFGNTKASRAYGAKKGAATRKLKTMIANRGVSKKRGK